MSHHEAAATQDAAADGDPIVPIGDFFVCRDYEPKTYHFGPDIEQTIECLVSASTDFDLTGQVVWLVSVLTSWYVASPAISASLAGKTLVELGAGTGLPGLLATKWADTVVLSDYEDEVLKLLEKSIPYTRPECDTILFNLSWGSDTDHERLRSTLKQRQMERSTATGTTSSSHPASGKVDVLLGADIVYWSASIEPLVSTADALLTEDGVFILGYFNRVDSMQRKLVEGMASKGLECTIIDPLSFLPSPLPSNLEPFLPNMTLYEFRRTRHPS
jgi:predicted nicotinamide N-methyase